MLRNPLSHHAQSHHRRPLLRTAIVVVTGGTVAASIQLRRERQRRFEALPLARDQLQQRGGGGIPDIVDHIVRTGLMGKSLPGAKSVKEELHMIRQWHQRHGYRGGIVLRELTRPHFRLYTMTEEDEMVEQDAQQPPMFDLSDPMRLARRECYYLYYELMDNGQMRQQIFCRGTTLWVDILTCLQAWWVHDEELQCRLHCGFRDHADRMLEDIVPLLAPPASERATIEVTGHSLGGAVALILAIKLRQRGYNVISATSIASPRFCGAEAAAHLQTLLPKDTLRIEDDRDIVPLLPPFGAHVGTKLWLSGGGEPRYIRSECCRGDDSWVDSVFWNFRVMEMVAALFGTSHRVRSHAAQVESILTNCNPKNAE